MRILLVNWQDVRNPGAGGAELHLHEIFGRLASRGHRIEMLVSGWKGASRSEEVAGIRVRRVGGRHDFGIRAAWWLRRGGAAEVDLVVEAVNKVPVFTPLWTPAPVVLLVHHLFGRTAFREAAPPIAAATWLLERPLPRVYREVPVQTISPSSAADLVGRGLSPDAISVLPPGVDLDRYTPGGSRSPEPLLLSLGRLQRYKSVDTAIRAIAHLRDAGREVRLVVAGRGRDRRRLARLARRLDVEELVSFAGYVPEERKVELYRSAWLHLFLSPKEGWGMTAVEAGACGTATVASDAPGLRDAVRDGRTGWLVPHGDPRRLAELLGELLSDRARIEAAGRAARGLAEEHGWDLTADRMEAYLGAVLSARRGARAHVDQPPETAWSP